MRLIDANALKKAFCNHCDGDEPCTEPCVDIGLIETAPTIDAVPVVRCRDCQWFDANGDYYDAYCDKNGISVEEDFFCADGERKDGERRTDGK